VEFKVPAWRCFFRIDYDLDYEEKRKDVLIHGGLRCDEYAS
jgi:hypothetical protein